MNPLNKLAELGHAVWLDDIHRELITSGRLKRLIEEDGLRGITSNPAIFKKAIADGEHYEDDIRSLKDAGKSVMDSYEALAIKDIQLAADEFRALYDQSDGEHGYVSLEVNPHLARYAQRTTEEARRLWKAVDRPNLFIKVPGTREGLEAIEQLVAEGINVNVTLLFGLPRYGEVVNAFMRGVDRCARSGQPINKVRSVASFFLSRIDVLLDPRMEAIIAKGGELASMGRQLRGEVAIASAKLAYQMHKSLLASERWLRLTEAGAHPQRLVWASTSTKNPDYSDVEYVEPLIGPDTINTMPMDTLEAYRDHGDPQVRLEDNVSHAQNVMRNLPKAGVDLLSVSNELENEGIEKFCKSFEALLDSLEKEVATA
jgi:transaldolase